MALVIGVVSQKDGVGKSMELKYFYTIRKPEIWPSGFPACMKSGFRYRI